jgi:hypothetical protein
MLATTPIIVVVVLALALISLIILPGAALIAIPVVIILGIVLVVGAARGVAAGRRGRIEQQEPGDAVGEALTPPSTQSRPSETPRETTQG